MRAQVMRAVVMALGLAFAAAGCGPRLEGLEKGERGKVAEVRDGDTLVLDDGLVVHLTGIDAADTPEAARKGAWAALEKAALHREAQLAYGGTRRGRGDAAFAHVFVRSEGGRWIWAQQALLIEGHARVRTHRENHARLETLLAAEAAARKARRGVWSREETSIRSAASLARSTEEAQATPFCQQRAAQAIEADAAPADRAAPAEPARRTRPRGQRAASFEVVEGRVASVAERERAIFVNFGEDIGRDFGLIIPRDALDAWPGKAADLLALEGKTLRVRGNLPRCAKPLMRVDHPAQIEAL